jgi:hypothetical protein
MNKYYENLADDGGIMDAGKLLGIMRPEVEQILCTMGIFSPPSQYCRVKTALGVLTVMLENLSRIDKDNTMDPDLLLRQRIQVREAVGLLNDFMAVHRTVCILEGKPL